MVAKINQKVNNDNGFKLNNTKTTTNPSGLDASKLSSSLSGKVGSFGSLTNSTLSASLEKTSSNKTTDVKTSTKAEEKASTQTASSTEEESVFTADLKTSEADLNEVSSTMAAISTDDIPVLNYAKTSFGNAQMYMAQADTAAQSGDWASVLTAMNNAKIALKEAQAYAQQAGDVSLQQQIAIQSQVVDGSIINAQGKLTYNSLVASSGTVATGTTSSSLGSDMASAIQQGLQSGTKSGTEQAVTEMFGGGSKKTSGTDGAGGAGKNPDTGKTQSGSPNKTSSKQSAKGLEYDRSNKEIEAEVKKEALPTYNEGTKLIQDAQSEIPGHEAKVAEATKQISGINYEISNLEGETEKQLSSYSSAKEALCQKDEEIGEQQAVIEAQTPIIDDCNGKITTKTGEQTTVKGELTTANSELTVAKGLLDKANAMPETTPAEKSAKSTALIQAEEKVRVAETKVKEKEAKLKQIEADLKDLNSTLKEAQGKRNKAVEKKGKLSQERTPLAKKVEDTGKIIENAKGKAAELKKELDEVYSKKTAAQDAISKCNANIDAGKMKQDLGENLRDNAVQKVKQQNGETSMWDSFKSIFN